MIIKTILLLLVIFTFARFTNHLEDVEKEKVIKAVRGNRML